MPSTLIQKLKVLVSSKREFRDRYNAKQKGHSITKLGRLHILISSKIFNPFILKCPTDFFYLKCVLDCCCL